jgi:hypothetical protein
MHTTNARTKTTELDGRKFQLRRLPLDTGSFIFMKMLGASLRMSAAQEPSVKPVAEPTKEELEAMEKTTGAMRVRALSFGVLSNGASFEDFKFIQSACMKVVSVVVERQGEEFPLPVMNDAGAWTPEGEDAVDVGMAMRLTTEVLIHCFADFFEKSSPGM